MRAAESRWKPHWSLVIALSVLMLAGCRGGMTADEESVMTAPRDTSPGAAPAERGVPKEDWVSTFYRVVKFELSPAERAFQQSLREASLTHTEEARASQHEYSIEMGGTLDSFNTRTPVAYSGYLQVYEPNRSLKIENVGKTTVSDAWVTVNGRNNLRDLDAMVAEATDPDMSDAEKARGIYELFLAHAYHDWPAARRDTADPVKLLNGYGQEACLALPYTLARTWERAGLRTRIGLSYNHGTVEVFYDGMWHYFETSNRLFALMRDNRTVAGQREIAADHDLMIRLKTYGPTIPDIFHHSEIFAARYREYENRDVHWRGSVVPWPPDMTLDHRMGLTLRPGESFEWRWDDVGYVTLRFTPHERVGKWAPLCNGFFRFRPLANAAAWKEGAEEQTNASYSANADVRLSPRVAGEPASVTWKVTSPYPIKAAMLDVAGRKSDAEDAVSIAFSLDGTKWQDVFSAGAAGAFEAKDVPLPVLVRKRAPPYRYYVRAQLQDREGGGKTGIADLGLTTVLQMSRLALPSLGLGENRVIYTDATNAPHAVRITHTWAECSQHAAPEAPAAPVHPRAGARVANTDFTFKWTPAASPDDRVVDYHFQLSDRPDMRWILSHAFDSLTSIHAPGAPLNEWKVPDLGHLNPGTTYYWRVRAKDERGAWSPWSETWSFTPEGPGVPTGLTVVHDAAAGQLRLRWRPNGDGEKPVRYRVYGSNTQGFTPIPSGERSFLKYIHRGTDDHFLSIAGFETRKENVVAAFERPECDIPLTGDAPVNAFYRVSAVDASGVESGASDYAAVPRPLIYGPAEMTWRAGRPSRQTCFSVWSRGHLLGETIDGTPDFMFFRGDRLDVTLDGPDWVVLEKARGRQIRLAGTPPAEAAGTTHDVTIKAEKADGGSDSKVVRIAVK